MAVSWARVPTAWREVHQSGIPAASPPCTGLGPRTPVWPVRPISLFLTMRGIEEPGTRVHWVKVKYGMGDRGAHPREERVPALKARGEGDWKMTRIWSRDRSSWRQLWELNASLVIGQAVPQTSPVDTG